MIWKARNVSLILDEPLVMGVINVSPDSFYEGGRFLTPQDALNQARRLVLEGADILDLGAESTRPGAKPVSASDQLLRLLPAIREIIPNVPVPVSVDTTQPRVAHRALEAGARIVNDVSGLRDDPELADVVRDYGAGLVLMHRRGNAETMQSLAHYEDVMEEVIRELSESIETALSHGVAAEQIVLDPGIGFAKTAEQSFELIHRLEELKALGRPILIGPSRKSFIGSVIPGGPGERLFGSVAASVLGFERGAAVVRTHDVKAVREALLVTQEIIKKKKGTGNSTNRTYACPL